jgi:hypothetical protein
VPFPASCFFIQPAPEPNPARMDSDAARRAGRADGQSYFLPSTCPASPSTWIGTLRMPFPVGIGMLNSSTPL